MKYLLYFFFVASTAVYSSFSQAKLVECHGCYSDTSYLNIAKSNFALVEGISYLYVANSDSGEIRKFKLRYESASMGERPLFIVTPTTVDSFAYNQFSDAMYYRSSIKNYFEYHKNVPREIAPSAWQLSGNPVFQRDIAEYYASNQTLREMIGNYTATISTLGGALIASNLTVTVKFNDQSTALYKIIGINSNGNLEFDYLKGTDELGNPIPNSALELEGQLKMSKNTLSYYKSAVQRFRFSFSSGSLHIPEGGATIVDCIVNVRTKEVKCESSNP